MVLGPEPSVGPTFVRSVKTRTSNSRRRGKFLLGLQWTRTSLYRLRRPDFRLGTRDGLPRVRKPLVCSSLPTTSPGSPSFLGHSWFRSRVEEFCGGRYMTETSVSKGPEGEGNPSFYRQGHGFRRKDLWSWDLSRCTLFLSMSTEPREWNLC